MTIRVGIVGAGGMGRRHAQSLQQEPDVRLTAVLDQDRQRAEALASDVGAEVFDDRRELLDRVDVVYVLTPPHRRVDVITAAAEAGKAIFCEKPLAATVDEGEAIVAVVERTGVPFMSGFCFRFVEPLRRLKRLVDDGALGELLFLTRTRMGWLKHQPGNWRIDPQEITGMAIESVSHELDMMRWLGGEVVLARGEVLGSEVGLAGYDDNVAATLRFASGAVGSVQATWASPVESNLVAVVGTRGSAVLQGPGMWDWPTLEVVLADGSRQVHAFSDEEATDMGWRAETQAFLQALRSGAPAPVGVHDAMAALRLSSQILASTTADIHAWAGDRRVRS